MDPQLRMTLTLFGGVAPGVVAFLALFIAWGIHARRSTVREIESEAAEPTDGPRWVVPMLIAGGLLACDWIINSGVIAWPTSATERYFHAITLIGLLAMAEGLLRVPGIVTIAIRAVGYGVAIWMLASPYVASEILSQHDLIGTIIIGGFGGSLIAHHADRAHETTSAWKAGIVQLLAFGGLMPIMFALGWAVGSMMLISVVAVLVNVVLVGLIFRRMRIARGGTSVLVGILVVLLCGAGIQSEPISLPALGAIALLPLAATMPGKDSIGTLFVRVAGVAVLLAATGGVLMAQSTPADDPYAEYAQ